MNNHGGRERKWRKTKITLMLAIFIVVIFCFGVRKTEEAAVSDSRRARLIVLPPLDGPEWEDMVDIASTVRAIRSKFGHMIDAVSEEHGVPPEVVTAVVAVESLGDPTAVSHKKAYGLMQLKMETARDMGISNPFHPYDNLWAGTKYLKEQWERFGSLKLALAAYNMGPNRLKRKIKNNSFDPDYYEYIRRVEIVLMYM